MLIYTLGEEKTMLTTIQAEQSDVDKLKSIAIKAGKPLERAFHEAVEELEQRTTLIDDEDDPDEKAFNEAVRSPKVRKAILHLNKTLDSLDL